jgi:hypothetical protein
MPVISRSDWVVLYALLAAAALLLAGNDNFGFDPPGYLDSFFYVGYFWHYTEHLPFLEEYYKLSRLPWVLPGFAAHSLAGPIAGTYVLVYATMAAGAAAMYLLVRDATGHRVVAAVVASAWACCTPGHGPGGFNYHVAGAAVYYIGACWSILRAVQVGSPSAAVLSGALFACAVHTHLFFITFAPLLMLFHVAAGNDAVTERLRRLGRDGLLALGGGLAITGVLAATNGLTGGRWLFFMPQIEYTRWLAQGANNTAWVADPGRWASGALYLVLPALFLLAGLAALSGRRDPNRRTLRVLVVQAWIALGILAYFQFVRRQTLLDHDYQAFALYVHAFPCLAAGLAAGSRLTTSRAGTIAGIATAVILFPLLALLPSPLPQWASATSAAIGLATAPPVSVPILAGLLAVAVMLMVRGTARLLVFAAWFSIVNASIAPAGSYGIATPGYFREMFALFHETDRLTARLDPSLLGIKYWMVEDDIDAAGTTIQATTMFDSYLSTRGWQGSMLAPDNAGLPIETVSYERASRAGCIGILSSLRHQHEWRERTRAHFVAIGVPLRVLASERFERPDIGFALTVFAPHAPNRQTRSGPPCAP